MNFLITLGYVPNQLFQHSAKRLAESISGKHDIRKLFIAKPFPKNTALNFELNHRTCRKYGYEYIKRETDQGAAKDFNLTLHEIGLLPDDLVFICDHDVYHINEEWDDALIKVMHADQDIDWASLWNDASDTEFGERGGKPMEIDGVRCLQAITPMMCITSCIRGSLLLETNGLIQPCKFYGGVEIGMWPRIAKRGKKKVFLRDFKEDQRLKEFEDLDYRAWKNLHATGRFPGTFAEYLCAQSE